MLSRSGVRQVQKELGLHFMPPEATYIDFATTLIQRGVATPVPKMSAARMVLYGIIRTAQNVIDRACCLAASAACLGIPGVVQEYL